MYQDREMKDLQREHRLYLGRVLAVACIVLSIMVGLVWRYYHLQITRYNDFVTLSERNRVHVQPLPPTRGLIYDRNGVLLADNRPNFTLMLVKERVGDLKASLAMLRELLPISDDEVEQFRKLLKHRRPYEAVPLRYNLTEEEQGILAVNAHLLPGVEVSAQLVRHYPLGEQLAHVLGYVSRISESELSAFDERDQRAYSGTHVIGKRGVENYYEKLLLGKVGSENVETNSRGRVMRVLERIDPQPGQDLTLFIDSRLQAVANNALQEERGSVVAIDTRNGGVLALVSTPGYNPNLFVTGISHRDYSALQSADRPLLNRSLQGLYPPGSTVKPVFGLAALESGVIDQHFSIYDTGFFQLPGEERKNRDWKKGGHGPNIDLHKAIEQSCDTFFWRVCYKMGIDHMARYGGLFGLGHPTGIDMAGEKAGIMPSREWKRGAKGLAWYPGDTLNAAIGQGFMLATPLQLAVMASRLANRGEARPPQILKAINGGEVDIEPPMQHINATAENWDEVQQAMEAVIHGNGTAKSISRGAPYRIAGKTGTAQVVGIAQDEEYDSEKLSKRNRDHALFIAYAPANDPRIAVAVVMENGEKSFRTAAIARQVMDAWLLDFANMELVDRSASARRQVTEAMAH